MNLGLVGAGAAIDVIKVTCTYGVATQGQLDPMRPSEGDRLCIPPKAGICNFPAENSRQRKIPSEREGGGRDPSQTQVGVHLQCSSRALQSESIHDSGLVARLPSWSRSNSRVPYVRKKKVDIACADKMIRSEGIPA